MPRLLDLILGSSAPPTVMHNAACGKLNVPPMERLEILVHLASHPELGEQARSSLQSWDEQELAAVCGGADIPASVAEFSSARARIGSRSLPPCCGTRRSPNRWL